MHPTDPVSSFQIQSVASLLKPNCWEFLQQLECWMEEQSPWEQLYIQCQQCSKIYVTYLDFSKTSDTILHNTVLFKLEIYEFDGQTIEWMRKWLWDCAQRVVVNGSMFRCRWETSSPSGCKKGTSSLKHFHQSYQQLNQVHPQKVSRLYQAVWCGQHT